MKGKGPKRATKEHLKKMDNYSAMFTTSLLPLVRVVWRCRRRRGSLLMLMLLLLVLLLSMSLPALDDRDGSADAARVGGGVPGLGAALVLLVAVGGQMPLPEHHPLVVVPLARGRRRPARHLAYPEEVGF